MSLPPRRDHQRAFWRCIRAGLTIEEASACLGMQESTARRWFRKAGGMPPLSLVEPVQTHHLNITEREKILVGMTQGLSIRKIAASIDREPSTVSRELKRNLHHQTYPPRRGGPGPRVSTPWNYSPAMSQKRADAKAARPKLAKLADPNNQRLREEVQDRLKKNHSPEQIANRLREDYPEQPEMWVSDETIYQSIYVQSRGALKRELAKHLRTGRALRKPRRKSEERRGRIPGMVSISERPQEAADRAVPGHWEGDLIIGSVASGSAIGTLVERKSRFTLLLHLPENHGALAVQEAMIAKIAELPEILRQTLTWDQGSEMANHAQIAEATQMAIYFCDPRSPWQRPTNENTNGLLRQYFPKGTDLSVHGPGYLDFVAAELNNRPRKTLNWKTPAEVLDQLLSEPFNPPGVAMTG